jgi:hypothetical protein
MTEIKAKSDGCWLVSFDQPHTYVREKGKERKTLSKTARTWMLKPCQITNGQSVFQKRRK